MGDIKCSFIKLKDGSREFICIKDIDKETSIACAVNNDDVDGKFIVKEKTYTCDTDPKTELPLPPVAKMKTTAFIGDDAFLKMVEKLKEGASFTATRVEIEDGTTRHVFKLGKEPLAEHRKRVREFRRDIEDAVFTAIAGRIPKLEKAYNASDEQHFPLFKNVIEHSGVKADATVVVRQATFEEANDGTCPGALTQESFMIFIDGDNINCSLVNKK